MKIQPNAEELKQLQMKIPGLGNIADSPLHNDTDDYVDFSDGRVYYPAKQKKEPSQWDGSQQY
jgi:hypothetical protein